MHKLPSLGHILVRMSLHELEKWQKYFGKPVRASRHERGMLWQGTVCASHNGLGMIWQGTVCARHDGRGMLWQGTVRASNISWIIILGEDSREPISMGTIWAGDPSREQ